MKKIYLLIILVFTALLNTARAGLPVKHYYDSTMPQLTAMLTAAKTDGEKLTALHNIIMQNFSLQKFVVLNANDQKINELLKINATAKLIDDKPYRTLLQEMEAKSIEEKLAFLEEAINEFDQDDVEIPELLIHTRLAFNKLNKQEDKYKYYTQKLAYYLIHNKKANIQTCYHCLGGYYSFKGDYNLSINCYLKAAEVGEYTSKRAYILELTSAGLYYNYWGNLDKATFYLKKALKANLAFNKFDKDLIEFVTLSLAQTEYTSHRYKESLSYLNDSSEFYRKVITKDTDALSIYVVTKALNYIAINNLQAAYQSLEKAKADGDAIKLPLTSGVGFYEIDFAFYKYYLATHDLKKAEPFLLEAYNKALGNASVNLKLKYLKELGDYYGVNGSTEKAWNYTVLYNHINDSLLNKTNPFKIASYEYDLKEKMQTDKVDSLKRERAIQDATIGQRNKTIGISFVALLAVCVLLGFIYWQLQANKKTLLTLRKTQRQLIQSEKLASLGELTAGIAHEIQNPLNFVNNFSEVSLELLDELKEEIAAGHHDEIMEITGNLGQNIEKIHHHGKRADSIVKGMLGHSRANSGHKEDTDVNKLADEYLRLAYHSLRAKDKAFNSALDTTYDVHLPVISIVAQDVGRVLLNLFNNAFYATHQKAKAGLPGYSPVVGVSTRQVTSSIGEREIEISIKDNGTGIPDDIKDKIMQPFFTTKPPGEGTGLGLSLSYDIVVKAHGGKMTMLSKVGEGTEFIITLPLD